MKIRVHILAAPTLAWLLSLASTAQATVYQLPKDTPPIVGEDQTYTTVYEDTLYDLARKYSLGSEELIRVNPGVDPCRAPARRSRFPAATFCRRFPSKASW
jgi:LysM repeat protein